MLLPLMRPQDYDENRVEKMDRAFISPKLDGVRVQFYHQQALFKSGDKIHGAYDYAVASAVLSASMCLEGEFHHPDMDFDTMSGIIRSHDPIFPHGIKCYLFDRPLMKGSQAQRLQGVKQAFAYMPRDKFALIPHLLVNSGFYKGRYWSVASWADHYYNYYRALGYEGIVIKSVDGFYKDCRPSKRSWDWVRKVPELTASAVITGAYVGKGKYANTLGGFYGRVTSGKSIKISPGRMSDEERSRIWLSITG